MIWMWLSQARFGAFRPGRLDPDEFGKEADACSSAFSIPLGNMVAAAKPPTTFLRLMLIRRFLSCAASDSRAIGGERAGHWIRAFSVDSESDQSFKNPRFLS